MVAADRVDGDEDVDERAGARVGADDELGGEEREKKKMGNGAAGE